MGQYKNLDYHEWLKNLILWVILARVWKFAYLLPIKVRYLWGKVT